MTRSEEKSGDPGRKGRVCAGNRSEVSCAIEIRLSAATRREAAAEKSAAAMTRSEEKSGDPGRKGRVCAGNRSEVSCAIEIRLSAATRREAAAEKSAAAMTRSTARIPPRSPVEKDRQRLPLSTADVRKRSRRRGYELVQEAQRPRYRNGKEPRT